MASLPPTAPLRKTVGLARTAVRLASALVDLALPAVCAGCGELGTPWCATCASFLDRSAAYPRIVAGRVGRAATPHGVVVAAGPYDGPLRSAIVAFKDGGRRDLLPVLAPAMRAALVTALTITADEPGGPGEPCEVSEPVYVVPAPSSPRSRRVRGDVPTHLLIRAALAGAGVLPGRTLVWAPVLRHTRRVADQARLTRLERTGNTDHAFTVRPGTPVTSGAPVLVADDVVTTGATARECVRALVGVGARPIAVCALAFTPARETGTPGTTDTTGTTGMSVLST
ncbi:hypothetical protein GCM10025883_10300 [Mobilicoccus caccae]|uniref:Amidophosphoribosyltransferase n=2 Tax=Mobilicoccus caccae TaxID=1859295 RepID=A0ABQ6INS6_9MICO|nr:hypothetical protein GCM10025883_10300 [Mobilicoccus caccae]